MPSMDMKTVVELNVKTWTWKIYIPDICGQIHDWSKPARTLQALQKQNTPSVRRENHAFSKMSSFQETSEDMFAFGPPHLTVPLESFPKEFHGSFSSQRQRTPPRIPITAWGYVHHSARASWIVRVEASVSLPLCFCLCSPLENIETLKTTVVRFRGSFSRPQLNRPWDALFVQLYFSYPQILIGAVIQSQRTTIPLSRSHGSIWLKRRSVSTSAGASCIFNCIRSALGWCKQRVLS